MIRPSTTTSAVSLHSAFRIQHSEFFRSLPCDRAWTGVRGVRAAQSSPDAIIGGDDPADATRPFARGGSVQGSGFRVPHRALNPEPRTLNPRAFTLVELLIVIGLIVLLVALAIPTFSVITGSRSVDSAANTISAFLGRARMEAIGLQETRGVMFFNDPLSGSTKVAIVRQAPRPTGTSGDVNNIHVRVYLDLADNKEFLTLPTGVGIQTVDDCNLNTSVTPWQRQDDGYIGFNSDFRQAAGTPPRYVKTTADQTTASPAGVRFGGVVLFDSAGRVVCEPYAFRARQLDSSGTFEATSAGSLLLGSETVARTTVDIIPHLPNATTASASVQRSQLGFVLYQKSVFEGRGSTPGDWQLAGSGTFTTTAEPEEERWLDENATVYLINRYNGTLVKGE